MPDAALLLRAAQRIVSDHVHTQLAGRGKEQPALTVLWESDLCCITVVSE